MIGSLLTVAALATIQASETFSLEAAKRVYIDIP